MTDHLPECPLLEPCSADIPQHGFCSRQNTICIHCDQNTICIHCERECICDRLRACEQRVLAGDEHWIKASTEANHRIAYRLGYDAGLDNARQAVAAVEDHPDAEIDYDRDYTVDPSGDTRNARMWLRDALAAIDALKEKP